MKKSEIDHVFEDIRYHTQRTIGPAGREVKVLDDTLTRARRLLLVASSVSARPDGYPTTTPGNGSPGGGKGGQRLMAVRAEDGSTDLVPTTSVEAAAIEQRPLPDPVTMQGRELWQHLRRLVDELDAIARVLDRFDRLQNTAAVPDPPMCWVAQVRYQLPWDLAWEPWRTTDFAGVLAHPFDEPRKVSQFVYWYTRNHRRLPERAEMLEYLQRGGVKVRA